MKYQINKNINKPLQFKGLQAQYIAYLGVGLLVLLILFAILFITGFPVYICLALIGGLGTGLFSLVFRFSRKHGAHGLIKEAAYRKTPDVIRCRKRLFYKNKKHHC